MTSNKRLYPDDGKPRDPSVLLGKRTDKRDPVGGQGLIQLVRDHSARQVSDIYSTPGYNVINSVLKVHMIENFFGSEFEFILFHC
jgi:hypothetical protein